MVYFDENGDLWIRLDTANSLPSDVETRSYAVPDASNLSFGSVATSLNLTKYIKSLIELK
jgi:hypothetical protein